jgi:hypothetical protein
MPASAPAQSGKLDKATAQIAPLVALHIQRIRSIDELRQSLLRVFFSGRLDGAAFDPGVELLRSQLAAAKYRAKRLNSILRHDLDVDGAVSVAELRRSLLPLERDDFKPSRFGIPIMALV